MMESSLRVANIRDYRREPSRSQVACSRCALGELCLPRGLTPDETERFEQIVHRSRPIQPGEHLFRAGDEFRSVASVRTGCFKSYVIDHEGQEQVLGFHLPGEIIGLDAETDLALLRLDLGEVPAIRLGSSAGLRIGDVEHHAGALDALAFQRGADTVRARLAGGGADDGGAGGAECARNGLADTAARAGNQRNLIA